MFVFWHKVWLKFSRLHPVRGGKSAVDTSAGETQYAALAGAEILLQDSPVDFQSLHCFHVIAKSRAARPLESEYLGCVFECPWYVCSVRTLVGCPKVLAKCVDYLFACECHQMMDNTACHRSSCLSEGCCRIRSFLGFSGIQESFAHNLRFRERMTLN